MSQDVCPYNRKFAAELSEDSPYAPRPAIAGKDSRARDLSLLGMSQPEFSGAQRRREHEPSRAGLDRRREAEEEERRREPRIDIQESVEWSYHGVLRQRSSARQGAAGASALRDPARLRGTDASSA